MRRGAERRLWQYGLRATPGLLWLPVGAGRYRVRGAALCMEPVLPGADPR